MEGEARRQEYEAFTTWSTAHKYKKYLQNFGFEARRMPREVTRIEQGNL